MDRILTALEKSCTEVLGLSIARFDPQAIVHRSISLFELLRVTIADYAPRFNKDVTVQRLVLHESSKTAVGEGTEKPLVLDNDEGLVDVRRRLLATL